jgi:hypothetical protein
MNSENTHELLIEEEVNEETLLKLTSKMNQINSEDDKINKDAEVQNFTLKTIKKGIILGAELTFYFLDADPAKEKSSKFKNELHKCLALHKEIYKNFSQKHKLTRTTDFLRER